VIEHVPGPTGLALPSKMVQVAVVFDVKLTARPEDALALKD
jgi:hypothetical protein